MRTAKEIISKITEIPSPEDPDATSPAYRWGWIDALRWVLGEENFPSKKEAMDAEF